MCCIFGSGREGGGVKHGRRLAKLTPGLALLPNEPGGGEGVGEEGRDKANEGWGRKEAEGKKGVRKETGREGLGEGGRRLRGKEGVREGLEKEAGREGLRKDGRSEEGGKGRKRTWEEMKDKK